MAATSGNFDSRPDMIDFIRSQYVSGYLNLSEIAFIAGTTKQNCSYLTRDLVDKKLRAPITVRRNPRREFQVIDMINRDIPRPVIAECLGIKELTIATVLRRHGVSVDTRTTGIYPTREHLEECVLRWIECGFSFRKTAEIVRVSPPTVAAIYRSSVRPRNNSNLV